MSANGSSSQEAGQPSEQPAAVTSPAPAGQVQPHPWAQGRPRAPLAPQQMVAPQRPQGGRGMRPQAAQLPGPPRPHHGHPAHNMDLLPGGLQPGRGAPPPFGAPPFRGPMPRPPDGGMLRPLPMPPQGRPPFRPPPPHQGPPGWGMPMQPQPPHPPHGLGGPPMARPPGPGMVQMGPGGPAGFLGPPVPPTQPPHHMSQSPWLSAPGGAPAARSEGARPDQHAAERPVQAKPGVVQKPAVLEKPPVLEKPASVEGRPEAAAAGSGQQQEQIAQSQLGGATRPQQPSAADVAGAWSAHKADDGKVYYHNTLSGESSWTKPQDFKGEDATAGAQPVPVSSTDVQGTEWAEVSCSDGKVYYYNATSKETTWQKPQAVADSQARGEAQEQQMRRAGFTPAHAAIIARLKASNAPALNLRPDLRAVEETDDDATFTEADIEREPGVKGTAQQPVRQQEAEAVSRYEGPGGLPQLAPQPPVLHSALPGPQQRSMQPPPPADGRLPHMVHPGLQTLGPNPAQGGPAPPQGPPPVPRGLPHAFGGRPPPGLRGHLGSRSNGAQALPPPLPPPKTHAELVAEYKELLLESQVTAFSRWEKVLPKLVEDSRYKAIPTPKERRQVFDDFCRNVAAEQKAVQARKEMQRAAAVPAFKALLDEAQRYQPGPPLPREQPEDQIEAGAKGDPVGKSSSPQPTAEAGKGSRKRERSPEARNGRDRGAKDSSRADKESSRKRSARDEADRGSRRAEDSHSDRHRSSRGSDARRGSPAERDKRRKKDSPKPERARDSKSASYAAGSGKQAGRQPGTAEGSSVKRDAQKEAAAAPGLSPAAAPAAAGPSGSTKQQDWDSSAAAAVAPEAGGRHSGAAQKAPEAELAAGVTDSAAQGTDAELPPPPPPGAPTAVSGHASDGDIQATGLQAGEEEEPPEDMEVDPNPAGLGATTTYEEFEHSWADDPRWQQCSEAIRRELFQERTAVLKAQADEAAAAQKALQEKEFRAMLQELHLHPRTKWLTLKGRLRDDRRYRAVPRGNREGVFNSFLAELERSERAAREEQRAAEDRRRALSAAQQEATRRQKEAAHTDAVAGYQTLLAEVVKDPSLRWLDCRDKLLKDPQGRASRPEVPTREQQQLFEKHIQDLRASLDVEFRQLLDQVKTVESALCRLDPEVLRPLLDPDSDGKSLPLPFRDFHEAVRLLEEDPRFLRVPDADRKDLWNKWVSQLVRELKDPGVAAAAKALKSGSSRGAERDRERQAKEAGIDKAYLREYFEPDHKRMRPT